MRSNHLVKTVVYLVVAVWALVLFVSGQRISSGFLRPLATVTSVTAYLFMFFELWLWRLPFLHPLLIKRPVIDGSWRAEIISNWKNSDGSSLPPIEGYVVIRQTLFDLSLRLMTKESSSHLVGAEVVCSSDGLYCVSGVYQNQPKFAERGHSPIHYGAVWLQVVETPEGKLEGHYWTDRSTAGTLRLTDREKKKFQDFDSVQSHYKSKEGVG
jgi:hypothetical protein